MTTQTWVGGNGTNWDSTSPTNWNAATPGSGDTAYLDAVNLGSPITVTVDDSISVGTILWQSNATDTAAIDIESGGYLTVGPAAGGPTFAGTAAGASITVFAGGSLQIGTSTSSANSISAAPVSVIFADDNPSAATVIWDSKSSLTFLKLGLTAFGQNDTLDVATSGAVTGLGTAYSAGVLTVTGSGGFSASVDIIDSGSPTSSDFYATYNGGYVQITSDMPCFLRGTRIATLRGEVAVENLRIGDLVVTAIGGALPVKWIGTRGFITRLVNEHHRAAMLPIRIAAGALGEGSPVRDLYVSPEHMLCLDDVLIPADKLLNGTTVTRADGLDVVQYFHIELPRHAVLYAEGALAESFLDTGNRNMFANVLNYLELGCDLDAPPQPACLPIVTEGEALDNARARLAERARQLGLATTGEDDLYLRVDGIALRPESREGERVRFAVPAGARQVHIVSRSAVPADLDPAHGDRRRLGICFSAMSLRDDGFTLDLAPGYAGFTTGFHAAEEGQRWTQGDALLPEELAAAMPDGFTLDLVVINSGLHYPAPTQAEVIPFASRRSA